MDKLFTDEETVEAVSDPSKNFDGFSHQSDPEWTDETVEVEEGDKIVAPIPRRFHFRCSEIEDIVMRPVKVGDKTVCNKRVGDYIDTNLADRDRFDTSQFVGTYRLEADGNKAKRDDGTIIGLK